jgi:putative addiction module CopG family antidote
MARASTINISLPGALGRYVREKVASGDYESPSDVIAASLKISKAMEEQQKQFWINTNEKVAEARREIANGEVFDGGVAMDEIIGELSLPAPKKRKRKQPR